MATAVRSQGQFDEGSEGTAIDPVQTLDDPEVKAYFLGILGSLLPAEAKYQRLVDFFRDERRIRQEILARIPPGGGPKEIEAAIARTEEEIDPWSPRRMMEQVAHSIRGAVAWLGSTQNWDGGWRIAGDHSTFWETALSALCLYGVLQIQEVVAEDIERPASALERGLSWLNTDLIGWGYEHCAEGECLPVYNLSLAAICYYGIGRQRFGEAYTGRIRRGMARLVESRCGDGGWYSRSWNEGDDHRLGAHPRGEVGATSLAVRALAASGERAHRQTIEKAAECVLALRNGDGGWNDAGGRPSVSKTCDGLFVLQTAWDFGSEEEGLAERIGESVEWLRNQEKPVLRDGVIEGWAWDYLPAEMESGLFEGTVMGSAALLDADRELLRRGYTIRQEEGRARLNAGLSDGELQSLAQVLGRTGYGYDYTATCATLEALVKLREPRLPMLVSNCRWLMEHQNRSADPAKRGGWFSNTARITLSLTEYYKQLAKAQEASAGAR